MTTRRTLSLLHVAKVLGHTLNAAKALVVRRLVPAITAAAVIVSSAPIRSQTDPVLDIEGDHFTVDDTPKFLFFVSYFDAIHASPSTWDTDLTYLKNLGVHGVRVFPNWFDNYCGTDPKADDTLIQYNGTIHAGTLQKLKDFLDVAKSKGLVVDVSFSRETVKDINNPGATMPIPTYQTGVGAATAALTAYPGILFDVQNEYNNNGLGNADAEALVQTVHTNHASRIATGSVRRAPNFHDAAVFDFVAYHDERNTAWYTNAEAVAQIGEVKAGSVPSIKPIDYQEPMPFSRFPGCGSGEFDDAPQRARQAAKFAKLNGAATWTFHTRLAFRLSDGVSLSTRLNNNTTERDELIAAINDSNAECWGANAKSVTPAPPLSIPAYGAYGTSDVTINGTCGSWSATTNQGWVVLTTTGAPNSDGTVAYTVQPNMGPASRQATITIAGKDFVVTQAGNPAPGFASFTDNPLVAQSTTIKDEHVLQLQTRIDYLSQARGGAPRSWIGPVMAGVPVAAVHFAELRTALAAEYGARQATPPSYSSAPAAGVTILKNHLQEVRAAVCILEGSPSNCS